MLKGYTSLQMIHETGPQEKAKKQMKIQTKTTAAQPPAT